MIRFIAAVDNQLGMATEKGIPWDLPSDRLYFREQTKQGLILMGYGTYVEFAQPLHEHLNYVATTGDKDLRAGFQPVPDALAFLREAEQDVWVIGGPGLFAQTINLAEELYLTRIDADFNCAKFFPEFEADFRLVSTTKSQEENNLRFHFEVWRAVRGYAV